MRPLVPGGHLERGPRACRRLLEHQGEVQTDQPLPLLAGASLLLEAPCELDKVLPLGDREIDLLEEVTVLEVYQRTGPFGSNPRGLCQSWTI